MDTTNILNSIKNISEVINIKENKDEVIKHSRDWRGRINNNALCVVFPKSNNDVSKLLKFANSNNLKVIPQGGNTSLVAGSSPTENEKEILINLKKMDKIIEIDNFNKCAVVEAGVIVDNLSDELNKIGKHFPVEMASTGSSQVGGIISTNAGGINVLRYGSVRQNILGLEVVTANGEILNLGSKVDGDYADPAMKMVILQSDDIEASEEKAEELLESNQSDSKSHNEILAVNEKAFMLNFDDNKEITMFTVEIKESGKFAFFTEHMPFEFEADEHFLKDLSGQDIEPIAQAPDSGHHDHHGHAHGEHDIHFWLDPEIAKTIVRIVARELSGIDPANASTYKSNSTKAMNEIDQLISDTKSKINSNARYVVFHDAYQYFEKRFGVEVVGALTVNPEVLPGAKQLSDIREAIEHENVNCLFSEPQFNPTIAETIAKDTGVKAAIIDPLGAELNLGKNLYFDLIEDIASSFESC